MFFIPFLPVFFKTSGELFQGRTKVTSDMKTSLAKGNTLAGQGRFPEATVRPGLDVTERSLTFALQ